MKQIITSLLVISIFSFNLFADNSSVLNLELDLKLGLDFNPTLVIHDNNEKTGLAHEFNNSFLLGADFFFLKFSDFYLGSGLNHIFESRTKTKDSDAKSNITTYHIVGKYIIPLESNIFSNLYLIGNLGYANVNITDTTTTWYGSEEDSDIAITLKSEFGNNNFFGGIGFGTELLDNFTAELTYSIIYGNEKRETILIEADKIRKTKLFSRTTYSLIMFKIGYKFNINIQQSNDKKEVLDKEIEKLKLQKEILELELEKEKLKQ